MALIAEIEKIIDDRVNARMDEIMRKVPLLRPWLVMEQATDLLNKESRWIISNMCTTELIEKELVKKVGGAWHFRNPEFFEYVHDVWWKEAK